MRNNAGKFIFTLSCGLIIGIIDSIPMILQGLDAYSIVSAMAQWLVASFVIVNIKMDIKPWLKGLLIGEVLAIPIIILVAKTEISSVLPMIIMSALLGSIVGFVSWKYENRAALQKVDQA